MIDLFVNLAFNLNPKTLQKSTQDASKIDKKGYRKHDASWLEIWMALGTILGGFWGQVGRQVGPQIDPKSIKNLYKKAIKKGDPKKAPTGFNQGGRGTLAP